MQHRSPTVRAARRTARPRVSALTALTAAAGLGFGLAGCSISVTSVQPTRATGLTTDAATTTAATATPAPGILAAVATIDEAEIRRTVNELSSDRMNGRHWKQPEGMLTAGYIAGRLSALGFEPGAADGSWFDDVAGHDDSSPNVLGRLPGTGDGIVLLTGHYDHLRTKTDLAPGEDGIYNGADDNASGIAGILAAARVLADVSRGAPLNASVYIIGFTGEESGLRGSRDLANDPPFALENVIGMFNCDMISRGESDLIYIDGLSRSPRVAAALTAANAHVDIRIAGDKHPDWLPRSDQGPFLAKGVEAVLFSVEDHEDYHQVTDHADKILVDLAIRTARLVTLAAHDLASGGK